jgi:hypothetical protein
MTICCESREVELEPYLWLPAILPWEIPGGEFASKCSRVVQRYTVHRSMNGITVVPGIDLHVFVGVKVFVPERAD